MPFNCGNTMSSSASSTNTMLAALGSLQAAQVALNVTPKVEGIMEAADIPGVSIARISPAGKLSCEINGVDLNNKNLTVDSTFQAASLSKAVFAYLVAQLANKGLFDLDRPLSEIVPTDPLLLSKEGIQREAANSITGRMVLSHSGGFHIGNEAKPLNFKPGTEFAYSGVGINLLQNAVETALGQPLSKLADEYVFKKLHLENTSFEPTAYSQGRVLAANSLKTTPSDYAKFIQAWVSDASLAETFIPCISLSTDHWAKSLGVGDNVLSHLAWGLGVGLELDDAGNAITAYHSGDMSEWRAFFAVDLNTKEVCVFMANSEQGLLLADPIFESSPNIHLANACDHFFQKYGFRRSLEEPANVDAPYFRQGFSVPNVEAILNKRPNYGDGEHSININNQEQTHGIKST